MKMQLHTRGPHPSTEGQEIAGLLFFFFLLLFFFPVKKETHKWISQTANNQSKRTKAFGVIT